jgi:16S rRNA (cytidine1402-2'-O)-methyltransferase
MPPISFQTHWIQPSLEQQSIPYRTLFVVALPIGNVCDITLRALHILSQVDVIAAEDTRHTRPLLQEYGINPPQLISLHQHNERQQTEQLIALLKAGKRIALVSDAGTPGICDPGAKLVQAVQEAEISVSPIVGASALTAMLSIAGISHLTEKGLCFLGFLPTKTGELNQLFSFHALQKTPFVCFESPHRIMKTFALITKQFSDWEIVIAREMTKRFEDIQRLPVPHLNDWVTTRTHIQGEFVLTLIPPRPAPTLKDTPSTPPLPSQLQVDTHQLIQTLQERLPNSQVASCLAKLSNLPKSAWYTFLNEEG